MQVIKLLVRKFRRLRLFFCGLLTRPTAPRHALWVSSVPSNPESAPSVLYTIHVTSRSIYIFTGLPHVIFHHTLFIAQPIPILDVIPFVMFLFTFGESDFYFDPGSAPVHG